MNVLNDATVEFRVSNVEQPHPQRRRSLRNYLDLVRFEHTLFALPFAYAGMLIAAGGLPGWPIFVWITLAMAGARTAAMALNRVIDARLDAANARTAGREIPRGVLAKPDALLLAAIGIALLGLAGWALNPLTRNLLPVAVLALVLYSYTKRFTWLCHLWLGATIGAAAAGGWIAVTGSFALATVALWVAVALWIAGFDVIYGILDMEFDRSHHIHSIPARFGLQAALAISAAMHALAVLVLLWLAPLTDLGWLYAVSVAVVAGVLVRSHLLVHSRGAGAALAAFNANLYVSSLILAGVAFDLFL
ncbi:MAG: UbiA-like polyprenyltransferase [Trueperaceae bacterium]